MSLPPLVLDAAPLANAVAGHEGLAGNDRRASARGKFVFVGEEKFLLRGVTYGPFGPEGHEYPPQAPALVDLEHMRAVGFNAVRTYTVPPRWLLDAAFERGLRVMVGLPWEQHVAFLDHRRQARDIERRVRLGVRACAGHPGVLCFAIGNEIPAPIVRWYGHRRVERYLGSLAEAARDEDPESLITYVNYPSTEYLELPFIDLACFNVYLEQAERLDSYVARLHNIVGDRPLVLTEIGLDSRRHGYARQALTLHQQIRTAFGGGSAGLFVFSWSDEWHRGGSRIDDWDFGLNARDGAPKPAAAAVHDALAEIPFPSDIRWPRVSVVVCSLNGGRTIRDCMEALARVDYPDYEVIVVNDGSTDATAVISRSYGFPVITTHNQGLGAARNAGWRAATGEIVAYIDDDAYPDPHWLHYLASTFLKTDHAAVGGPNIPPEDDGTIAKCVARSPGGPIHVLVSDREAEHIPGCNMAFRKSALEEIGGFDPRFRVAGDDVDICWRLRDRRLTIGFNPAAVVWHHRRNSLRAYWRQQRGYGKAEALLEQKWPERYNAIGHVAWTGGVYGPGSSSAVGRRFRIYQGTWGSAAFQVAHRKPPPRLSSLLAMPETFLLVAGLVLLSLLGLAWSPLLAAAPLALSVLVGSIAQAWGAAGSGASVRSGPRIHRAMLRFVTAVLTLMQPLARLQGRVFSGLTPWRGRGGVPSSMPRAREFRHWRESWEGTEDTIRRFEASIQRAGAVVSRAGPYDRWELEARTGTLGSARVRVAIEEHGAGRQQVRVRTWPRVSPVAAATGSALLGLAAVAGMSGARIPSLVLGTGGGLSYLWILRQCSAACGVVRLLMKEWP